MDVLIDEKKLPLLPHLERWDRAPDCVETQRLESGPRITRVPFSGNEELTYPNPAVYDRSIGLWFREVAETEEALVQVQTDAQAMLENPEVPISQVIRKNAERAELMAYLKGLKFLSPIFDPQ